MVKINSQLFTFFLSISLLPSIGAAGEMKPLEVVRQEFLATSDLSRLEYGLSRCSSLQFALSALMLKSGSDAASEKFAESALVYMNYATIFHEKVSKQRGVDEVDAAGNVHRSVKEISKLYAERMNRNQAASGDYVVSDRQLKNEAEKCREPELFVKWFTQ